MKAISKGITVWTEHDFEFRAEKHYNEWDVTMSTVGIRTGLFDFIAYGDSEEVGDVIAEVMADVKPQTKAAAMFDYLDMEEIRRALAEIDF